MMVMMMMTSVCPGTDSSAGYEAAARQLSLGSAAGDWIRCRWMARLVFFYKTTMVSATCIVELLAVVSNKQRVETRHLKRTYPIMSGLRWKPAICVDMRLL